MIKTLSTSQLNKETIYSKIFRSEYRSTIFKLGDSDFPDLDTFDSKEVTDASHLVLFISKNSDIQDLQVLEKVGLILWEGPPEEIDSSCLSSLVFKKSFFLEPMSSNELEEFCLEVEAYILNNEFLRNLRNKSLPSYGSARLQHSLDGPLSLKVGLDFGHYFDVEGGIFYLNQLSLIDREAENLAKHSSGLIQKVNQIEFPIVLIETLSCENLKPESRRVVLCNSSFSSLGFENLDMLYAETDDLIELKGEYFRSYRQKLGVIYDYVQLTPVLSTVESSRTYSDLGIVASSIAHELNNPVASILAGLELMKLLMGNEQSEALMVPEIEKNILRVKDLISLFLGFSRFDLKSQVFHSFEVFNDIIKTVQNLLNTKFVECGLEPDFQIKSVCESNRDQEISFSFNRPVMTIVLYLILDELILAYNQENLVAPQANKRLEVEFQLHENTQIEIFAVKNLRWGRRVSSRELIKDLLAVQGFKLEKSTDNSVLINLDV